MLSRRERARKAVLRYAQLLQKQGVPQRDACHPLVDVSNDIARGVKTEAARSLVGLYEAIEPGPGIYDESAKDDLFAELRVAATFFQKGLMGYPTSQNCEDSAKAASSTRTVVCSDVHLGTKQARREAFYQWLNKWRDTSIILLGDILDLWIYSDNLDDDGLIEHVVAEWRDLWKFLSEAKDRGCRIHFVPGNHDAFVYFVESADNDKWSQAVLERTPLLRGLRDRTRGHSLLEVADLHYPYFRLQTGPSTILLTHGHYATWGWRLMAGLEDGLKLPPTLASAGVFLAHKNARLLRRFNNEVNWLRRTHQLEDTAISITNAVLLAYKGARQMLDQDHGEHDLVTLVDRATALYFGGITDVSAVEELKIREALLNMHLNRTADQADLLLVRDRHLNFLRKAQSGSNVDLSLQDGSAVIAHTPLSDFAKFDAIVFGHFHSPRDADGIHDIGGFVDTIKTFVSIGADGRITR